MAKNTKVSSTSRTPITSYFAPLNKSSRQRCSSPHASTTAKGEIPSKLKFTNNQFPASPTSDAKSSGSLTLSPTRSERVVKPVPLRPSAPMSSLKRAREPNAQLKVPSVLSSRVKGADRRKSKFDSASEDDNCGAPVIYVNPSGVRLRKKARVSPPPEASRPSNSNFIPSSQSDEEELPYADDPSPCNRDAITGRLQPSSPLQNEGANAIAVDVDIVQKKLVTQALTPPLRDSCSPPLTPTPGSTKKSSGSIIAAIKARAYENSLSPEPEQLDFEDLDSDDDDPLPVLPLPSARPTNEVKTRRQTDPRPTRRAATRLSLRNRPPSPLTTLPTKSVRKGSLPFASLLKEKNQAVKHGNGSDVVEKADMIVLQHNGKDGVQVEMEEEEDEVLDWGANISSGSIRDILNSRTQEDSDLDLDVEGKQRILQQEGGKTVLDILAQDKCEKLKSGEDDKISGIQLWTRERDAESSAMIVDQSYNIPGCSPVVILLNNSLTCGATVRTKLLLNMNLMSAAQPAERSAIASCLLDICLSSNSSLLPEAALNALTKFWSSSMQPLTSTIVFNDILNFLKGFGVDPNVLMGQHWDYEKPGLRDGLHNKDLLIPGLVSLITACAQSGRLRKEEILDICIAMMLIGMDVGATPTLRRDLNVAIESSLRCLRPDDSKSREEELALKVMRLSASYSPINKLRLLSLLSDGSGPSRRIANFVAYCMITTKHTPNPKSYTLPPLLGILDQLHTSGSNAKHPGVFALHEGTDYVDLGFYVNILGIAVSDVKGYVSQERQKAKSSAMPESPGKMGDRPKTDLQLLHVALETLHSKISDSRAAHLDRSRTKAAVKQLAMNIHYQREFWLRHSQENKSVTLAQFFKKQA